MHYDVAGFATARYTSTALSGKLGIDFHSPRGNYTRAQADGGRYTFPPRAAKRPPTKPFAYTAALHRLASESVYEDCLRL